MSEVHSSLTSAARAVFSSERGDSSSELDAEGRWPPDRVLRSAWDFARLKPERYPEIETAIDKVFAEPDLSHLGPLAGGWGPMVFCGDHGARIAPARLVSGLFVAAYLHIFYRRLPNDEETFVRTVLEGFEGLRRAARGQRVDVFFVSGISGVHLPQGARLSTPWGELYPVPIFAPQQPTPSSNETYCMLVRRRSVALRFDQSAKPKSLGDGTDIDRERSKLLFPLACALATPEGRYPGLPRTTWETTLLPFQGPLIYEGPLNPGRLVLETDLEGYTTEIEHWARVVDQGHSSSVDVSARRLATAISHRTDATDVLIDAVMVWENLVGTESEVSFRVTASLAKTLETNPAARRELRNALRSTYDLRSRVVHGVAVDKLRIDEASSQAVDVALRVLRAFYRRGASWMALSSAERANTILLEDP